MPGYAFISYSHHDASAYVLRLAAHLEQAGIDVWYDVEIITGERWARLIQSKIVSCDAVIVVMTPAGEDSKWVAREVSEAEHAGRTILPLLLTGDRYFELGDLHFEDVRSGAMPSDAFVARLRTLVGATATLAPDASDETTRLTWRQADAVRIGDGGGRDVAIAMLRGVVARRTELLGPDHPDTLSSRHELARQTGNSDITEAIAQTRQLVADRSRVLGVDDVDTLSSRNILAIFLSRTRRAVDDLEAVVEMQHVVAGRTRILGPDHPDTLESRYNLAMFLGTIGRGDEAGSQLADVAADSARVLGPDHPLTTSAQEIYYAYVDRGGW